MKNVIILLALVIVLGGGWWIMKDKGSGLPTEETKNTQMTTETSGSTNSTSVKEFIVEGSSFAFAPKVLNVNKGDTVKITFVNRTGFHDFVIDEFAGAKTKQINGGQSETITFVADKAGSFEYYCSVGTHRQMGMVGTLVVK